MLNFLLLLRQHRRHLLTSWPHARWAVAVLLLHLALRRRQPAQELVLPLRELRASHFPRRHLHPALEPPQAPLASLMVLLRLRGPAASLAALVLRHLARLELRLPALLVEPGRGLQPLLGSRWELLLGRLCLGCAASRA